MRSLIGALLLGLVACDAAPSADTQKPEPPQGAAQSAPTPAPTPAARPGTIDRSQAGKAGPAAAFVDRAEKSFRLADFAGQPVLVNLWATWCAPCLAEMPALDRLAAREKGKLVVLPVSQDLEGWRAVDKFFVGRKFTTLTPYLDQPNDWALAVGAKGLPVSILYDAQSRELWRVNGPLEWDDVDTAALGLTSVAHPDIPPDWNDFAPPPVNPRDPWAVAQRRGIDFRAVGNEPGWWLEMDYEGQMKLVADYGERTFIAAVPPAGADKDAVRYRASAQGRSLSVEIRKARCSDGMSDSVYPSAVTVEFDGKIYKGCGRDL